MPDNCCAKEPKSLPRVCIAWATIALAVTMGFGMIWLFCAYRATDAAVERFAESNDGAACVAQLGGQDAAARKLAVYLKLPNWIATRKGCALELLPSCGKAAVPILLRLSREWEGADAFIPLRCLGYVGPEAKEAVPDLVFMLSDKNAFVRAGAAWALGGIGPEAISAVRELEARVHGDEDEGVRTLAAQSILAIKGEVPRGYPRAGVIPEGHEVPPPTNSEGLRDENARGQPNLLGPAKVKADAVTRGQGE